MKYDYLTIYEKNTAFLQSRPLLLRLVKILNVALCWMFVALYAFLWIHALWIEPMAEKELVGIALPPALTWISVTALQWLFDRPRPYDENGANITPLQVKKKDNSSFPSRHLACASAIAMAFLCHFTLPGVLLLGFTLLLGYLRFALGWHYPSDLFAGAGLGIALGGIIFFI